VNKTPYLMNTSFQIANNLDIVE